MTESKHCDDYIHDINAPRYLRFFLLWNRMPAADRLLLEEFRTPPTLFADHEGKRVRVVMVSRLGDVGITRFLDKENGYGTRVFLDKLSNFGEKP